MQEVQCFSVFFNVARSHKKQPFRFSLFSKGTSANGGDRSYANWLFRSTGTGCWARGVRYLLLTIYNFDFKDADMDFDRSPKWSFINLRISIRVTSAFCSKWKFDLAGGIPARLFHSSAVCTRTGLSWWIKFHSPIRVRRSSNSAVSMERGKGLAFFCLIFATNFVFL